MRRWSANFLLVALGVSIGSAQDEPLPPRTVRILPLGDPPPFRQEIRNGIRYELPPPPGSVPPLRVEFTAANSEGAAQKVEYEIDNAEEPGLRLRLNDISTRVTLPGEAMTVVLEVEEANWHRFQLPEGGDFLLVMWRDPEEKTWDKARSRLVPDGVAKFKAGDLRFINVGPVTTRIEIGRQEKFEMAPGKAVLRSMGVSSGTPTTAFYQDSRGGWRRLWSSALVQNRGERSTVAIYRADGEKPRRPLKLIAIRERAKALPKERPAEAATSP